MIKILIVCKNDTTAKIILNNVISQIPTLRLVGIANTLKESTYFIEKSEPNLIMTTEQSFIDHLNDYNTYYTPGLIFISNPDSDPTIEYKQKKSFLYIPTDDNYRMILARTLKFIAKNINVSKKYEIKEILENIGFNFRLSGTIFLLDSLTYIKSYEGAEYFENLSTDVYPFVARKHNTTPQNVKWSIERSLKYLYQRNESKTHEVIEEYFGIKAPEKITPKVLITSIIDLLHEN